MTRVEQKMRYLLVTSVPFAFTDDGGCAVNTLWGWDLKAHSDLFSDLHVIAPKDTYDRDKYDYIFPENTIHFHALPKWKSSVDFICKFPMIFAILYNTLHKDDIVHTTATAHSPIGLLANFICRIKGCVNSVIVFDADAIGDLELRIAKEKGIRKISLIALQKILFKVFTFCISHTALTFVVGDAIANRYRNFNNVIKIYASWVKKTDIISPKCLGDKIADAHNRDGLRICFAASLIPKKNPKCAIEVIKLLRDTNIRVTLDILGEGPLRDELEELVNYHHLSNIVTFINPIPYGKRFYNALQGYDAILVPNLSNEQPRIIFDAMANGVVVIGSDIESFSIIKNGENGLLCDPKCPESFVRAVEWIYKDKWLLEHMIYNGINTVEENTLESMHRVRAEKINHIFKLNIVENS